MKIAVHAFAGISLFHLAAPLLVFGEVARQGLGEGWEPVVWSESGAAIRTAEGQRIEVPAGPEAVRDVEIAVFPSWHADLSAPGDELLEVVRDAHERGAMVVGLCLGAFPVVASGVLGERAAVTHWAAADALAARHPGVPVDASALYIDHGDVLTSAGTASGLDACLHIVRDRLGAAAATQIARHIVIAPHREGGQAQYIRQPLPPVPEEDALSATSRWALEHLDRPLGVDDLAAHARMSPRHFARRFHAATGATPAAWLRARRLDAARTLLEQSELSIAEVARAVGFASPVTFRQRFTAAYATTPTSYRKRFAQGAGGTQAGVI
ncbi:GlxA family transcriptional regulator [Brachybacterium saurashtrense]|uniref:Helix-turn-helix domain-containing protein n=1 Tax=Brachybacterium saurashtrense TaxID=556288 RepID=A0A345YLQ6_9MICO|nr:helix-turn-helix domain-containing protein [Brachybacterium saurashtrense]AXK44858.1 helix-turn-helix domain-containing protein [Brachybacterium saurashtrense]RRR20733.1 helix-turn-helix domain-containing protein [Brachybacterium saurashtrense]